MILGEASWTAGCRHQHYALGTSQVMEYTLPHILLGQNRLNWENWGSGSLFSNSKPGLAQGYGQGCRPSMFLYVKVCVVKTLVVIKFFLFLSGL